MKEIQESVSRLARPKIRQSDDEPLRPKFNKKEESVNQNELK